MFLLIVLSAKGFLQTCLPLIDHVTLMILSSYLMMHHSYSNLICIDPHSMFFCDVDLACRNCLVASDLTVKIADFGFSKELVNTGYYRPHQNAYLPLRWMAPECLLDGIFDSKGKLVLFLDSHDQKLH